MTSTPLTLHPTTLLAPQLDYLLIDGSGSMLPKWYDFLAAADTYLDTLRSHNLNSHIIASVFDALDHSMVQRDTTLSQCTPFSKEPLGSNWAGTPLYDAINTMCRSLRDLDPPRCSILIVTDGGENASRYTDQTQAKALLDWCRAKGWQITFIGCDFNNSSQALALGASPESVIGVQKKLLSDATRNLGEKRAAYGLYGTPIHFTEGERTQFGGYLNAPQATS